MTNQRLSILSNVRSACVRLEPYRHLVIHEALNRPSQMVSALPYLRHKGSDSSGGDPEVCQVTGHHVFPSSGSMVIFELPSKVPAPLFRTVRTATFAAYPVR